MASRRPRDRLRAACCDDAELVARVAVGFLSVTLGDSTSRAFLFSDVVGSTRRWAEAPDVMRSDLTAHDEVLQAAIVDHGGTVFSRAGDSFAAAFTGAAEAVASAVAAQQALGLGAGLGRSRSQCAWVCTSVRPSSGAKTSSGRR